MPKWQNVIGWTAVTIGAFLLLVIVAAAILLHSPSFHRYLLSKLQQAASESTGATVEIQDFQLQIRTLTADVFGLVVHGTEAADEKPLLQVQHARIGIKIISIFRRKVNLSELVIEHPVVNLTVDKQGHSNLPQPPPAKNKSSSTNVVDLAVGHVLLANGQIVARDQAIPVDADLNNLHIEISFDQLHKKYDGTISYDNGLIQYQKLPPLAHRLNAAFDVSASELNVKPLQLKLGGSKIELQANVRDYASSPVAQCRYSISVHTQDFAELSKPANATGDIVLRGDLNYRDVPGQSTLRNVSLSGGIASSGLTVAVPQAQVKIQRIGGKYRLVNGNFQADGFQADLLNGRLTANGTIAHVDTSRRSRAHIQLAGISLREVKSSLRHVSPQSAPVTGTLNATADATWQGTLEKLRADTSLTMRGGVITANKTRGQNFPLSADVRANYDGVHNLLTVASGSIQLPATSIRAQGQVGNSSNLTINAKSSDLHQLMLLAAGLPSANPQDTSTLSYPNIRGAATLNALIRGTLQNPQVTAQVSASGLQVNQSEWKSIQAAVAASPKQVEIQNASLVSAQKGQLNLSGSIALRNWSYDPSDSIAANVQIERMRIAELQQIANAQYPVEGEISGRIELHGSELNPQGQGAIHIDKAKVSDEPLKTVSAQFQAANGTVDSKIVVGKVIADVSVIPKAKAYKLNLHASTLDIAKSHTVQAKNLPVRGLVTLSANGAGTFNDPQLAASVQIEQLQLRDTSFSRVRADLRVANHIAKLELNSGVQGAALRGRAVVRLSPGYYTEASLDTSRFAVDPFLAMYMPSRRQDLHGETELHASVKGPAAEMDKIEAHITIPVLNASYQSLQIAAAGPIRADYTNSVVVLQPAAIKGTDTSLQFQGRIPLKHSEVMKVSARGSVGLKLAQMFNSDLRTGGNVAIDVNAGGTVQAPSINGQVRLENASFSSEEMPLGVQDLNVAVDINEKSIQITNGSGKLGSGELHLGGSVTYRPQLEANVALSAKSVRIRYPEGVRTVLDSELTLTGNQQASLLQGRVLIDSLSFTSDFDISTFMSQFTENTSTPPTGQSMADNLKLQIAVQSTSQLSAGTAQLGFEGTANLRVIGTASEPVIVGRADLTSGDIFFQKNQYHLERGTITFANASQTTPVLNVLITTTINQYNLSITIRGPIEKLQTTYVSDPALPPADIISLIARGQTTTEGQATSFGTDQVLAAGLGQVGGEVTKLTGISGLQIDPLIGGENSNPSARIGIQKRVTRNFIFTFSTDVTQPQSEIVQGEYQLTKRWSVSAVRNESGGVAVDGKFHTNF